MEKKRELTITYKHLTLLWVIVALFMLVVFVFGLHAGRDQGLRIALEEQGVPMVRFPVGTGEQPGNFLPNALAKAPEATSGKAGEKEAFDFGAVERVTDPSLAALKTESVSANNSGHTEQTAGLVAKSTANVVSDGEELNDSGVIAEEVFDQPVVSRSASGEDKQQPRRLSDAENSKPQTGESRAVVEVKPLAETAKEKATDPKNAKPNAAKTTSLQAGVVGTSAVLEGKKPVDVRAGAKKPEPKQVAKTEPQKTKLRGWYVQLAAPRTRAEADSVLAKARKSGYGGTVQEVKVKKTVLYRVLIGPQQSKKASEAARSKLSARRVTKEEPFVKNFIGNE
jgi:cell division septation protein DedD